MKRHPRPRDFHTVQSGNGREPNTSRDDVHARVAALAYSFYERRGREHGHDVEDWIQAEKSILEETTSRQNGSRARSGRQAASRET